MNQKFQDLGQEYSNRLMKAAQLGTIATEQEKITGVILTVRSNITCLKRGTLPRSLGYNPL